MAGLKIPGPLGRNDPTLRIGASLLGRHWFAAPPGPIKPKADPGPEDLLVDLRLVSGASEVRRGTRAPANTRYAAAIRQKDAEVIVEVVLQGATDVPKDLTWSGGQPVSGAPLRRAVSRAAWARHELTARLRKTRKSIVVYVIGAKPTGFQGEGGTSYADNKKRTLAEPPGMQAKIPDTGEFHDKCQIQFTVQPEELVTDARAKRFNTDDIRWDVTREILDRTWSLSPTVDQDPKPFWTLFIDEGADWKADDRDDDDEDNDPWSSGHLYGNDRPGHDFIPSGFIGLVRKFRAREWVRVNLRGGAGRAGTICSDYQHWHMTRSLIHTGGAWVKATDYDGNELKVRDPGWGKTPTHGQRGR